MTSSNIVQKVWNYSNVLCDDEMSCGNYVEQLTYLLFLKMGAENGASTVSLAESIYQQELAALVGLKKLLLQHQAFTGEV